MGWATKRASLGLGWGGAHGPGARHSAAERRPRRRRLQPHAREGADLAEIGATIVDSPADLADRDIVFTMVAGSADVEEVVGPRCCRATTSRPGLIIDSTTISPAAAEDIRARAHDRGTAMLAAPGQRQPEGRRERAADHRRLGPGRRVRAGAALPGAAVPPGHLRRRGRARAAGQDLPQPHARRRRPVPGRDHGAGGEGRRRARRLPGVPQRQRDGVHLHAVQEPGLREPRLQAHLHARRCCSRTSTSASRPRGR